jgi:NADH-quinone oxidoreductase subunit M
MLSLITFLPLLGAILVLLCRSENRIRWIALAFTGADLLLTLYLMVKFNPALASFQFVESHDWIRDVSVKYKLGVDGLSIIMLFMTTLISFVSVPSAWKYINKRIKSFYFSLLFLETAMIGVFLSLDLVLFYVFWEAMLIPMAIIIGVWGGERRIYSAIKFFIYTFAGSIFLLVGIAVLFMYYGSQTGNFTFDIVKLTQMQIPLNLQKWLFLAFFIAFAIKVPVWPFHTWLPDAHVEAPTPGSVILAGILLKMGTYGFLRFCLPMFPQAFKMYAPFIFALGIISIIYAALVALVQKDVKKIVAYSSVSHMGFVMIGMFSLTYQGIQGAIFQMLNHGLVSAALFMVVGIIYERIHTRQVESMGGIATIAPKLGFLAMVFTMAAVGLPGTSSFVGEFLTILGGFKSSYTVGALMTLGVIFGAAYMLYMYRNVFFLKEKVKDFFDLDMREFITLSLLALIVVWLGFKPDTIMNFMTATVGNLISNV